MGSRSNRYSEEFKRDAIALARSSDRTVTEVARELGISPESLRSWVNKDRQAETKAAGGRDAETMSAAEQEELRRLRKLTAEQAKTIEILKKATAFFAQESDR
ncbi:transposase [Nonomuraea sp. NPDC055795]